MALFVEKVLERASTFLLGKKETDESLYLVFTFVKSLRLGLSSSSIFSAAVVVTIPVPPQKVVPPSGFSAETDLGRRLCSFDGDADRLVYHFFDEGSVKSHIFVTGQQNKCFEKMPNIRASKHRQQAAHV